MLYHVGIIPDGNRRWARSRGLTLDEAYMAGYAKLKEVARWLLDYEVKFLSIYAMSLDNCIKRSELEKKILFKLLSIAIEDFRKEMILDDYNASLIISGDINRLPEKLKLDLLDLVEEYKGGRRAIHIGICYSMRGELLELGKGRISLEKLPPIDLVIRTGGMSRLSGFFPLLVEYAELYFTNTLWPDFSRRELEEAIEWYRRRERNFGV